MRANNPDERALVVHHARRWLGTPYHHRAHVLGSGVDCAQLLLQSFQAAGLVEDFDPGMYEVDWHMHRDEEKYLATIERWCHRVDVIEVPSRFRMDFNPLPGDILMWRVGRTFSHSAIVTSWPFIIHSYLPSSIVEEVDLRGTPMAKRSMRHYSFWGPE